jgi:hypothetical protein
MAPLKRYEGAIKALIWRCLNNKGSIKALLRLYALGSIKALLRLYALIEALLRLYALIEP